MSRIERRAAPAFAIALASAGCAAPDPLIEYRDDPYAGDAYPERRPLVVPPAGMAIVTDSRSDTLSLLDLGTGERFASYPVGRDPVDIDGPVHAAVDEARGMLFVTLSYPAFTGGGPHADHGSSLRPGYVQKLALDDLRVAGQVRVASNALDVALSEDGERLVVSHFDLQRALDNPGDLEASRATLAVIDPEDVDLFDSGSPTFISICLAPSGIALSRPDGARAFAACYGEDALAVVDLDDPYAEPKLVPMGPGAGPPDDPTYGPYEAVLAPDGATVAVCNTTSKDVRFFDVATETMMADRTLKTPGAPFSAAFTADGERLYVATQAPDAVVLVDLKNGDAELASRSFTAEECQRPHAIEPHGDGAVLVVCEGDGTSPGRVVWLDAVTLKTVMSTEVGLSPMALARAGAGDS